MPENPNPQGKGQVPMLVAWEGMAGALPRKRDSGQFLLDYLVGSLVLAANIRFRPVVGKTYFLYWRDDEWSLSLISPEEWGDASVALPVAQCQLREDMSWEMSALDDVEIEADVLQALENFQRSFLEFLDNEHPVEEGLPFYSSSLSWHSRLLGLGLSKSLQGSRSLGGELPKTGRGLIEAAERAPLLSAQSKVV